MGFIREWAQQAGGAAPTSIAATPGYPWAAIVHNIQPPLSGDTPTWGDWDNFFGLDSGGTFNIVTELYAMRRDGDGSAYENAAAYNPSALVARVDVALDALANTVSVFEGSTQLPQLVQEAHDQAELLIPEDEIDDLIAAFAARQETDHQQAVSALLAGAWLGGSLLTTRTMSSLALLEDGRQRSLAEYTAKLRLAREEQRTQVATQLLSVGTTYQEREISVRQQLVAASLDAMRMVATIEQDRIDKDVEYLVADKFWDLSLLQLALNANSSIYGAQMQPRAQTKGERLAAGMAQAASIGIQGGMALGNPLAGVALGGLSLIASQLG